MKIQNWKFECYNLCKGISCTGQHVTDDGGEWVKREDADKLRAGILQLAKDVELNLRLSNVVGLTIYNRLMYLLKDGESKFRENEIRRCNTSLAKPKGAKK